MINELICALIIQNNTKEWVERDQKALQYAQKVCKVKYNGCLVKFLKKELGLYQAICRRLR